MNIPDISMADFQYDLPEQQIAQYPLGHRDQSKLLVYKKGKIQHCVFSDLIEHLPAETHLVFNDTKVIPARLIFSRNTGAKIEIFLLEPIQPSTLMEQVFISNGSCIWNCTIGNKKKWKVGEPLVLKVDDIELKAELIEANENHVRFTWNFDLNFGEIIKILGNIPLPPYMNRAAEATDSERYQTVFANQQGAVAAPTASLHFTEKILQYIEKKGIKSSFLTLHVGAGTFMPVKVASAHEHNMHSEQIIISKTFIQNLIQNHIFVIPAGTTAMRTLESLYWYGFKLEKNRNADFFIEKLYPYSANFDISIEQSLKNVLHYMQINALESITGHTEILIMPGYEFKICKGIVTNFHQPGSTLLLLIAALVGKERWKDIYSDAQVQQYRFLSYGDSSLLIP
jgi:S-adenosylmethionine:tRNA ribosyltransferase-isomerase